MRGERGRGGQLSETGRDQRPRSDPETQAKEGSGQPLESRPSAREFYVQEDC